MEKKQLIFTAVIFMLLSINVQLLAASGSVKRATIISGQAGSGPGQIGFKVKESEGPYEAVPSAIAADTKGNVYIADIANDRIQKYDNNGNLVNSMKIENIRKGDPWVDDMTIDNNDNLYVAHGQTDQKIYKYNSAGALIQSIDLLNKNLCWDAKKGWSRCYMQIERITVDVIGNIYLVGRGQLIKFNPEGQEEKKWSTKTRFEIPIIVLDEIGNLYLKSENNTWEKYDRNGNNKGIVKCERPYFKMENGKCNYPRFVDKNGSLYFYETRQGKSIMVKIDQKGKRYGDVPLEFFQNLQKIDAFGNLYNFNFRDDKFWVEKITWN